MNPYMGNDAEAFPPIFGKLMKLWKRWDSWVEMED